LGPEQGRQQQSHHGKRYQLHARNLRLSGPAWERIELLYGKIPLPIAYWTRG
jgi:hypothetical protein